MLAALEALQILAFVHPGVALFHKVLSSQFNFNNRFISFYIFSLILMFGTQIIQGTEDSIWGIVSAVSNFTGIGWIRSANPWDKGKQKVAEHPLCVS